MQTIIALHCMFMPAGLKPWRAFQVTILMKWAPNWLENSSCVTGSAAVYIAKEKEEAEAAEAALGRPRPRVGRKKALTSEDGAAVMRARPERAKETGRQSYFTISLKSGNCSYVLFNVWK